MSQPIIYHNPQCSKSEATLKILEEKGYIPKIVEYLTTKLQRQDLVELISMFDSEPLTLIRTKESLFKELGLSDKSDSEKLIAAIIEYPILLERPIVVYKGKAKIGRPPEAVLTILDNIDELTS